MRERLAYLHIPKAAGTSLRAGLSSHFSDDRTVPWSFDRVLFGDFERFDELGEPVFLGEAAELRGYDFMAGHWTLPTILEAFDTNDVVCVLREPRVRLLSHYMFWRSWPDEMHDLWQPYLGASYARLPLGEFLSEPAIAHQADNLSCRLILGRHDRIPSHGHIRGADIEILAAEACERVDQIGYSDVLERGGSLLADLGVWSGTEIPEMRLNETGTGLGGGDPIDTADLADAGTLRLLHLRTAADRIVWEHVASQRGLSRAETHELASVEYSSSLVRIAVIAETRRQQQHREASDEEQTPGRARRYRRRGRELLRGARRWAVNALARARVGIGHVRGRADAGRAGEP